MNADRLAPWYRWIEYAAFGGALEQARSAMLHHLLGAKRVLVIGEGDGRALELMLAIAPDAHFDVFELSPAMIALASQRIGATDRVHFFPGDVRAAAFPEAHYDAVVTFFVLDCFPPDEARDFMARLALHLAPGGRWLVCEFVIPPAGWPAFQARVLVAVMYGFFRWTTGLTVRELPPVDATLAALGLQPVDLRHFHAEMVMSAVWARHGEEERAPIMSV